MPIILVDVVSYSIGGYFVIGYWWLLMVIILVVILLIIISEYSIVDIGGY
jgi:hypothetical protein